MVGLAVLEIFDLIITGLKVAKTIREEAPAIYDAIQGGHPIDWTSVRLPDQSEEPPPCLPESNVPDSTTLTSHLHQMLLVHEGVRRDLYTDTVGKWTIGCGRNLSDVGLRDDEVEYLLANDMRETLAQLYRALPWVTQLSSVRQAILGDMLFNLGLGNSKRGLLSFKTTLSLIQQGHYAEAADAMLKSKWSRQVGQRARRLATMMRTDQWPDDLR
jgi:lysozyme